MTSPKTIRIGSRQSPLARKQVDEVLTLWKKAGEKPSVKWIGFNTAGDTDKSTSLITGASDDFFTDQLDRALLDHTVDLTIHSAKDLPKRLRPGLEVFALTAAMDTTDAWVGKHHWNKLPDGTRVGTSSLLRQAMIKQLKPKAVLVDIRGTIDERLQLIEKGLVDGVIVATCALKRLGLKGKIKDVLPWEGTPLQGQLAIVGRSGDKALKELCLLIDERRQYGSVTLVGAGPGDPDLITVKGARALKTADCVVYDYLVNSALLTYAPKAEHIFAGKRKGAHSITQEEITNILVKQAKQGRRVVRLKGGDPFIFARGSQEWETLKAYHIPVSVVPGISAATGVPASLGIPLTDRTQASSVAFISGHVKNESGETPSRIQIPDADTLVIFMGLTKLPDIVTALKNKGWNDDAPVMIVSKGTWPEQKILKATLTTIVKEAALHPPAQPALILVGPTLSFWDPVSEEPNSGAVLYCGTHPEKYRQLGDIVHWPMIQISAIDLDENQQQEFVQQLCPATVVLLTSRFAVNFFMEIAQSQSAHLPPLTEKKFAVIGQDTAYALREYGIEPDLIPADETSEGLFDALKNTYSLEGLRIFFPRSALPNPFLKDHLTAAGARVHEMPIYDNTQPDDIAPLPAERIDRVIFTSPSTVHNFLSIYGPIPKEWAILAKGERTQRELKLEGYESEIVII